MARWKLNRRKPATPDTDFMSLTPDEQFERFRITIGSVKFSWDWAVRHNRIGRQRLKQVFSKYNKLKTHGNRYDKAFRRWMGAQIQF